MKKGKKIVIGVAAVAVVAGGIYAVAGEAAVRHSFLRFQLQRQRPEMWRKS